MSLARAKHVPRSDTAAAGWLPCSDPGCPKAQAAHPTAARRDSPTCLHSGSGTQTWPGETLSKGRGCTERWGSDQLCKSQTLGTSSQHTWSSTSTKQGTASSAQHQQHFSTSIPVLAPQQALT